MVSRCNTGSLLILYPAFILFSRDHMLSRILFTAGLLASILPLASHAQTAPRFYVGAGASLFTNMPSPLGDAAPRLYGPALTAGL